MKKINLSKIKKGFELVFYDQEIPADEDSFLHKRFDLDSLQVMQFVSYLEKNFDVNIENTKILPENFSSIITVRELLRESGIE